LPSTTKQLATPRGDAQHCTKCGCKVWLFLGVLWYASLDVYITSKRTNFVYMLITSSQTNTNTVHHMDYDHDFANYSQQNYINSLCRGLLEFKRHDPKKRLVLCCVT